MTVTESMIILRRIPSRAVRWRRIVAAIGIFDGVHRGHQAILRKAVRKARRLRGAPMAVTFHPHPLAVLRPRIVPPLLLSLEQRLQAFAACGIQAALVIPFTRGFSRWLPREFVERVLIRSLKVREVVVGDDFGFGVGRSGSLATLREFGRVYGFKVHGVRPIRLAGQRVASRRIRDLIRRGRLAEAGRWLGRPVAVEGRVVRGAGRGRALGFSTANLRLEAGVLPKPGVYAVFGKVGNRTYAGMANIGLRPTFNRTRHLLLEVHLFGWTASLLGRRMEVAFLKRLRSERRFSSPEALRRQLTRDARRAAGTKFFTGRRIRGKLGSIMAMA